MHYEQNIQFLRYSPVGLKGIDEFSFQTANAFKVHDYWSYSNIYVISSALLEVKIAMKVILDPKICEIYPIRSYLFSSTLTKNTVTVY